MKFATAILVLFLVLFPAGNPAVSAEGLVSMVVSSPIFANGTVRDIRSGINIYLQRDGARGAGLHGSGRHRLRHSAGRAHGS